MIVVCSIVLFVTAILAAFVFHCALLPCLVVAVLAAALAAADIFVLRKKGEAGGYKPTYKCPGGLIMPIIAIFMTCTLIYGEITYAPIPSLICAVITIVTGLPAYKYFESRSKKA